MDDRSGTVLLTVPHATCPPRSDTDAWWRTGNHACDFGAPPAAVSLEAALVKCGRKVEVLSSPVARTTTDMNRSWSRDSEWRKHLAARMRNPPIDCLIDVHSFPPEHEPFGGSDIMVMSYAPEAPWQPELVRYMRDHTASKIGYIVQENANDIIRDAHSHGVPAVLIEFSEGLTPAQLAAVTRAIAAFVCAPIGTGNAVRSRMVVNGAASAVGCVREDEVAALMTGIVCVVCMKPAVYVCKSCWRYYGGPTYRSEPVLELLRRHEQIARYCSRECQKRHWEGLHADEHAMRKKRVTKR
jgi:hypothetical protein